MDRRTLLQIASVSVLAGDRLKLLRAEECTNGMHGSATEDKPYVVQFFTPAEMKLLDEAMEAIIPADEHSPGAHQAQTALFADLIVSTSPDDVKQDWRAGLQLLANTLQRSTLPECFDQVSANQWDPQSPLDVFFVKLKQMTVEGYYTSSVGIHQDLQYQGNTYRKEFKGCTDAEHQGESGAKLRRSECCGSAVVGSEQTA